MTELEIVANEVTLCFASIEVKRQFLNSDSKRINVTSLRVQLHGTFDGNFQPETDFTDGTIRKPDTTAVQNDLSSQVVDKLQPIPPSTVTGNITPSQVDNESGKSAKNENVKGSIVKQSVPRSILGAINPLAKISSETSDNFNTYFEDSSNSQPLQEQLHFFACIQRQTETFSNLTSSKSGNIVSSSVTFSHSSSRRLEAAKAVKPSSVPTGPPISEQEKLDSKKISKTGGVKLDKMKRHTLHCVLHVEPTCHFYGTQEECHGNYDQVFATGLIQLLRGESNASTSNNTEITNEYMLYIVDHLKRKVCPSACDDLWRYCISQQHFTLLKFADEGLLIHSETKAEKIGTICKDYFGYRNMPVIGIGGFGKVYKYTLASGNTLALKDEIKCPIINGSPELFQRILSLKYEHLIQVVEYVVGAYDNNTGKRSFLCVMPFMNQRGLDEQFKQKNLVCVMDYMCQYLEEMDFIFRNFTVVFKHVFKALYFLETHGIIHRDVKSSNILVQQNCSCTRPLRCKCPGNGRVLYVLGDLDLLCLEEDTSVSACTCEVWNKMVQRDPAGTVGMKPPEAFFKTGEGAHVITHKSDVWSGCVTMMNVLIGKGVNIDSRIQISDFLKAATKNAITASHGINESSTLLDKIADKFEKVKNELPMENSVLNNEVDGLNNDFRNLKQLLSIGKSCLQRMQSFQGSQDHSIYHEENPLAGILTTVYGANTLHWKCLSKLPLIYNTPLWVVMQGVLDIIVSGVRFMPENRQDASKVLKALSVVYDSVFKVKH